MIPPFVENAEGPVSARWEKWREHFEAYLAWKDVENHEDKFKNLLMFGGPDIRKVIKDVQTDENHAVENRYHVAMTILDDYFVPKHSRTYERQQFREMKPAAGEKFDSFVIRLKRQAAYCDYGDQLESLVVDQIITTTSDVNLKQKYLEKERNLEEILKVGRTHESVRMQIGNLKNRNETLPTTNTTETEGKVGDSILKVQSTSGGPSRFRCFRCNGRHNAKDPSCPGKSIECRSCGQVGHFARCCFLKKKMFNKPQKQPTHSSSIQKRKRFVREISSGNSDQGQDMVDLFHLGTGKKLVQASVGGVSISFVIDTGADEDVLAEMDWKKLKQTGFEVFSVRRGSSKVFNAYGSNAALEVLGEVDSSVAVNGKSVDTTFYVIQNGKCSPQVTPATS